MNGATEILSTGDGKESWGTFRKDFPGGWPGDTQNKFTEAGRTPEEQEAYQFTKKLIQFRNSTPALQTGKLMQFAPIDREPEKGIYVYFRYDDTKTIMVILNFSDTSRMLDTHRFQERMAGYGQAKNILSGDVLSDLKTLEVPADAPVILELIR